MIRTKVTGIPELLVRLKHTGERVKDSARKKMISGAEKIVKEAKLNSPVDEKNLEDSIRLQKQYGFRGRLYIEITMGGIVNGVNVDAYAIQVHENYESMGVGPGTRAKREANPGRYIGEKFLTRAAEDQEKELIKAMISVTETEWVL